MRSCRTCAGGARSAEALHPFTPSPFTPSSLKQPVASRLRLHPHALARRAVQSKLPRVVEHVGVERIEVAPVTEIEVASLRRHAERDKVFRHQLQAWIEVEWSDVVDLQPSPRSTRRALVVVSEEVVPHSGPSARPRERLTDVLPNKRRNASEHRLQATQSTVRSPQPEESLSCAADSGCGLWTVDCGLRTVGCGLWAADCGLLRLRTADCGLRTSTPAETSRPRRPSTRGRSRRSSSRRARLSPTRRPTSSRTTRASCRRRARGAGSRVLLGSRRCT